jgi:hypothetical protein
MEDAFSDIIILFMNLSFLLSENWKVSRRNGILFGFIRDIAYCYTNLPFNKDYVYFLV